MTGGRVDGINDCKNRVPGEMHGAERAKGLQKEICVKGGTRKIAVLSDWLCRRRGEADGNKNCRVVVWEDVFLAVSGEAMASEVMSSVATPSEQKEG